MEYKEWGFVKWKPLVPKDDKEKPKEEKPEAKPKEKPKAKPKEKPKAKPKEKPETKPEEKRSDVERIRKLLNNIAPPTKFTKDDETEIYVLSDEKATKKEVKILGKLVQDIIDSGIYPEIGVSNDKYNMHCSLFDELIRQITIERPELNSILLKIRDHFRQEIYNYEQVYQASFGYGYRKFHMQNIDDRLNELEAESKNLLERQDRAAEEVDRVYKENRKTMLEYKKKAVDELEYEKQVAYYKKQVDFYLYYFEKIVEDARKELDGDKDGAEHVEDENLEEEESVADDITGLSMGEEQLVEEEVESPFIPREDKEVKPEKPKEEPIDKDLIYRENEELVFASEYSEIGSIVSESLTSETETVQFSETSIYETLKKIDKERLLRQFSASDIQAGYMKKAFAAFEAEEEQQKLLDQQKLLEQQKLNEVTLSVQRLTQSSVLGAEVPEEEECMEEDFEEEELKEEGIEELAPAEIKESLGAGSKTYMSSALSPHILRESIAEVDEKTSDDTPFMNDPKFTSLRTIGTTIKCEDLIPTVKEIKFKPKTESEKLDVKEDKTKDKEPVSEYMNIEEKISESEFKEGIPYKEYLELLGEECEEEIEGTIETVVAEPEIVGPAVEAEEVEDTSATQLTTEESEDEVESILASIGKSDSTPSINKVEETDTMSSGEEESESGCGNSPLLQLPTT